MADVMSTTNPTAGADTGNSIERDDSRELAPVSQTRVDELRSAIAEVDWKADPKGHEEVLNELKEIAVQDRGLAVEVWRSSAPDVAPPDFLQASRAERGEEAGGDESSASTADVEEQRKKREHAPERDHSEAVFERQTARELAEMLERVDEHVVRAADDQKPEPRLSADERAQIVSVAERAIDLREREVTGSDPVAGAVNQVPEDHQRAAIGVARSLAAHDGPEADNPFKNEQLQSAYKNEQALLRNERQTEPAPLKLSQFPERAAANERDARNPANDQDVGRESGIASDALAAIAARRERDIADARRALGLDAAREGGAFERNAPPREREQPQTAGKQQSEPERGRVDDLRADPVADKEEKGGVPKSVSKKFLQADNTFHYRDRENKVAFEDRGRKMMTAHNDPDVVGAMVDMAESKGWSKLKVAGHEDFRRETWLQASLRGIEVSGYTPKDVDLARLAELEADRRTNSIAQDTTRERSKDTQRETTREASAAREEVDPIGRVKGVLLEHGKAPYQNDPDNNDSYYVKHRDAKGAEHTTWGVDLERAVGESGAKIGDTISLENKGKQWVNVSVPVRNTEGKVVGREPRDVHRNAWDVQVEGMAQVLKDKGYSDQTIAAAKQAANKQMAERAEQGKAIPTMRIHDAKAAPASRQRTQQPRQQPTKVKEKEPAR
jgi:hypothetical protein